MEMKPERDDLIAPHGSHKQAEPDDPLALVGTRVPGGDIDCLLRCFIEEYAAMGHDAPEILELFRQPQYAAIHPAYLRLGEEVVRTKIASVLNECGVFRVTARQADVATQTPMLPRVVRLPASREDEQP